MKKKSSKANKKKFWIKYIVYWMGSASKATRIIDVLKNVRKHNKNLKKQRLQPKKYKNVLS